MPPAFSPTTAGYGGAAYNSMYLGGMGSSTSVGSPSSVGQSAYAGNNFHSIILIYD